MSLGIIEKAYDAGHPEKLHDDLLTGGRAKREFYYYDRPTEQIQIERQLTAGKSLRCIAKLVGCGVNTVARIKNEMLDDGSLQH